MTVTVSLGKVRHMRLQATGSRPRKRVGVSHLEQQTPPTFLGIVFFESFFF